VRRWNTRFEYGVCATPGTCSSSPYGASAPIPNGFAGEDFEIHSVSAHAQYLSPHTTYHFRVVAHNETGGQAHTVAGEERTFRTQGAGGELILPNGRSWELVSSGRAGGEHANGAPDARKRHVPPGSALQGVWVCPMCPACAPLWGRGVSGCRTGITQSPGDVLPQR
jgi:hypothetical protein